MKKFILLTGMLLCFGAAQAQNGNGFGNGNGNGNGNNNGLIHQALAAAQQAGCMDGINPALHATITGTVTPVRVPCGEAITGLGNAVYLYAPTPCPPNAEICIQVIVPIAEVVFGCGEVLSVTCLSNGPIQ